MDSCAHLLQLPESALSHVLSFLDPGSLALFGLACKQALQLAEYEEHWQALCAPYGVQGEAWRGSCFRLLYGRLLHKYGRLIGLWHSPHQPYGAVVRVQAVPPRHLEGRLLVVLGLRGAAFWKPLFRISASTEPASSSCSSTGGGLVDLCCAGPSRDSSLEPLDFTGGMHAASIELGAAAGTAGGSGRDAAEAAGTAGPGFIFACSAGCDQSHAAILARQVWPRRRRPTHLAAVPVAAISAAAVDDPAVPEVAEAPGLEAGLALELAFLASVWHAAHSQDCRRMLLLPLAVPGAGGQPLEGLWRGTYGGHGIEVLRVQVVEGRWLQGFKLTGDPNVPAGEVSFKADLTAAQRPAAGGPVPFQVPDEFSARVRLQPGQHRLVEQQRMPAEGRIAGAGFADPQWTPAELVVCSEHCFAVLWLELGSCALFTRVPL